MCVQRGVGSRMIERLLVMGRTDAQLPIGQQVSLPVHFDQPVKLESAQPIGKGFECRVGLPDGTLEEAAALAKLTANRQSVIEDAALTPGQREEKKPGQKQLI